MGETFMNRLFGGQDFVTGVIGLVMFLAALALSCVVHKVHIKRAHFLADEACNRALRGRIDVQKIYAGDRLAPILIVVQTVLLIMQIVGFALMVQW